MRTIFVTVMLTYTVFFIGDYLGARSYFSKADCEAWLKHPWYLHLMIPGPGNYCIDQGILPKK